MHKNQEYINPRGVFFLFVSSGSNMNMKLEGFFKYLSWQLDLSIGRKARNLKLMCLLRQKILSAGFLYFFPYIEPLHELVQQLLSKEYPNTARLYFLSRINLFLSATIYFVNSDHP